MASRLMIEGHVLQPAIDSLILENKSSRQISAFCKENGLNLSHVAVAEYMKRHKDEIQIQVKQRVDEIREQAIEEQVSAQVILQAILNKGFEKLNNGDYEDLSMKDLLTAVKMLVPTQIVADVTTTVSMEDVISTLQEGDTDDNVD